MMTYDRTRTQISAYIYIYIVLGYVMRLYAGSDGCFMIAVMIAAVDDFR